MDNTNLKLTVINVIESLSYLIHSLWFKFQFHQLDGKVLLAILFNMI